MRDRDGSLRPALPVAALFLFAAVAGTFRLHAYDLFWHLASGRWIVEHGAVPSTDPFRFTSSGARWIDHGWLFQIAAYAVERAAGLDALVVARILAALLLAAVLLVALRRSGAPTGGAVLACAAAVLGARPRLMIRPELFSVLAVAGLLAVLQELRRSGSWRWVAAAGALGVVWANVHPGVLIAPVLALAFVAGCCLPGGRAEERGGSRKVPVLRIAAAPLVLALAVPINPYGFELLRVPLEIERSLRGLPVINPEWLPAWAAPQPALMLGAAALGLLVAGAAVRAGRIDPATALPALALAALAASAVRHQGLFFVGGAFLAGEALADLARRRALPGGAARGWGLATIAVAACLLAAAWCVRPPRAGPLRARQGSYVFGFGIEPGRFPEGATTALDGWPAVTRPYNDVAFGGYLIWRRYPREVFIDGRNEVDPGLLRRVAAGRADSRAWNALLDRYGIDGALVRYDEGLRPVVSPGATGARTVTYHTSSALLFPSSRFALVYWDDLAMVFVRRLPELAARIEREEYRFVQPEDERATLEAAGADPSFLEGALDELARRLAEGPCPRAEKLRAELLALQQEAAH